MDRRTCAFFGLNVQSCFYFSENQAFTADPSAIADTSHRLDADSPGPTRFTPFFVFSFELLLEIFFLSRSPYFPILTAQGSDTLFLFLTCWLGGFPIDEIVHTASSTPSSTPASTQKQKNIPSFRQVTSRPKWWFNDLQLSNVGSISVDCVLARTLIGWGGSWPCDSFALSPMTG